MTIRKFLMYLSYALWPKRCPACHEVICPEDDFCEKCAEMLEPLPGCDPGKDGPFFTAASKYRYVGPAAALVKRYKFGERKELSEAPARWMLEAYQTRLGSRSYDAVVSVPTSALCLKSAEFDHNRVLAACFSELAGLPYRPELLKRERETERQTKFGAKGRFDNMRGAFSAAPEAKGLRILVADDIITTGATLSECTRALLSGGASRVDAVTALATMRNGERS